MRSIHLTAAGLALGLGLVGCANAPRAESPKAAAPARVATRAEAPKSDPTADIVAHALPAVVLLLNTHDNGTVSYGAGLLVDRGLVLTSEHVVTGSRSLGAMLYRSGRATYTPMDGGLSRFLFENQGDVVRAKEVSGDATSDLALVRIEADTSDIAALKIATEPVKPGDRVLALGHPQETVWSFTQGVVGAIQEGAIQHDAMVSHGSSGGPLLNARGELVGINVAKVVNETNGLAFARPIALATRYLGGVGASAPLDLSSPEASAVSCWRGQEIGRVEVGDCFDWESAWVVERRFLDEAKSIAKDPLVRARIANEAADPAAKAAWIAKGKRHTAGYFVEPCVSCDHEGPVPQELREARERLDREEVAILKAHPELKGLRKDRNDPSQMKARLRLGIRVGGVTRVREGLAWVELVGRNADGSLYRFSELYAKVGDKWLQRMTPTPDDEALLPHTYAPPLDSYSSIRLHRIGELLRGAAPEKSENLSPAAAPPMMSTPVDPACTNACEHPPAGASML